MEDQTILLADETGNFTGEYASKIKCHTGSGHHHLAITVLLTNDKDQVLLQKRKHAVFDDIWDLTGATHPLHKDDGSDETYESATQRCLVEEWGIEGVALKNHGSFNYFAQYGELCENEFCAMLTGIYNGPLKVNESDAYGYKWMDKNEFLLDIAKNPTSYSPWAISGVALLENAGFFD